MVVYIVRVQEYNYLVVQLIPHVLDRIFGQTGLRLVDAVLLVVMAPVRLIEIVQDHHYLHLVMLHAMDQTLTSLLVIPESVLV
jgi:hypothetical protein